MQEMVSEADSGLGRNARANRQSTHIDRALTLLSSVPRPGPVRDVVRTSVFEHDQKAGNATALSGVAVRSKTISNQPLDTQKSLTLGSQRPTLPKVRYYLGLP